ncbi:FtsW/RodA/SpoVE family cell cycle protein [Candidatus Liberibacter sp.]|uniref:FtsW/RodA/SpoVE family cell cycle protein n=1 Tax=Candidatus Liberibacter sp. TaxID=34022 RepID=UPI0015F5C83F|nr:putative peptidoglycan glycosyltransferase FtsW [Candidatus Liberibacter sp.]MBA5724055.1 cell division protein FtsW [Candidatus Liberibacter sp.]
MVSRTERGPFADWFWTIDRFSLMAFLFLMGLGFMLSFASSPSVAEKLGLDSFYFVKRHAFFLFPSILVMISFSFFSSEQIRKIALIILFFSLTAMLITLFLGVEIKGARRWLNIAGISIQPSEFMKPAFIVVCSWLFSEQARQPEVPGNLFSLILFGIVVALLVAQPDFGQSVLMSFIWGSIFFATGVSWLLVIAFGIFGLFCSVLAYKTMPHVANRINHFFTGTGDSFQIDSSREAIIRGGWFGQGPGEGTIKRIIPDSHTDFVFSVAAEEFGILFCMMILCIFTFVVVRAFLHSFKEPDYFNRLAVVGLALQIGFQATINIGVNLQILPTKGMTMPTISYGGSSMLGMCMTIGFLLSLTRHRPERRATESRLFRISSL